MKLVRVGLLAWLAGVLAHSFPAYLIYGEVPSRADVLGVLTTSFVGCALLFGIVYTPAMRWLMRCTERPAWHFALLALLLTTPVFAAIGWRIGTSFLAGEGILFIVQFAVSAACFGLGFAWTRRTPASGPAA